MNGKKRDHKKHTTLFYIETLVLAAVFIGVILVLTQVFARSRQMSLRARAMTCAVHLAENTAEAVSAAGSVEELALLLDEGGNVRALEGRGDATLRAQYDREMKPVTSGSFWVDVTWAPETGEDSRMGSLVESVITVYWNGEEVYTLDTAVYCPGE